MSEIIENNAYLIQEIIDELKKAIEFDIIVCSKGGRIIAATRRERISDTHPKAKEIIEGKIEHAIVTVEDEEYERSMGNTVKAGCNYPVCYQGKVVASAGIAGDPEKTEPFCRTVTHMVKYILEQREENQQKEQDMRKVMEKLQLGVEETTAAVQQITAGMDNLLETENRTMETSERAYSQLSEIEKIVDFIKKISDQSHMLGLNASIEAARAGEHGKGFSVVAEEIRKLADESKQRADEIYESISALQRQLPMIKEGVENNNVIVNEQSKALESISKKMEDLIG